LPKRWIVSAGGSVLRGLTLEGDEAVIAGTMWSGQTVSFTGSSGVLTLYNRSGFRASISGLSHPGQKIDLGGFAYSSGETAVWSQSAASGTLTLSDGGETETLTLIGTYAGSDFHLATDGNGGTYVTDPRPAAGFTQAMAGFSGRTQGIAAIHAGGTALASASPLAVTASSER
jgi:hypothetical protein